jgi:tetratricopeptide (TPR) repeat protein
LASAPAPAPIAAPTTTGASPYANLEGRAVKLYRIGEYQDALPLWKELIIKDPLNPDHYNNLGLMMKKLGRWEEAIDQYQKAARLDPVE